MAKIAVITGASRGIGRACAMALAADGFEIWANSNRAYFGDTEGSTRNVFVFERNFVAVNDRLATTAFALSCF